MPLKCTTRAEMQDLYLGISLVIISASLIFELGVMGAMLATKLHTTHKQSAIGVYEA